MSLIRRQPALLRSCCRHIGVISPEPLSFILRVKKVEETSGNALCLPLMPFEQFSLQSMEVNPYVLFMVLYFSSNSNAVTSKNIIEIPSLHNLCSVN